MTLTDRFSLTLRWQLRRPQRTAVKREHEVVRPNSVNLSRTQRRRNTELALRQLRPTEPFVELLPVSTPLAAIGIESRREGPHDHRQPGSSIKRLARKERLCASIPRFLPR